MTSLEGVRVCRLLLPTEDLPSVPVGGDEAQRIRIQQCLLADSHRRNFFFRLGFLFRRIRERKSEKYQTAEVLPGACILQNYIPSPTEMVGL